MHLLQKELELSDRMMEFVNDLDQLDIEEEINQEFIFHKYEDLRVKDKNKAIESAFFIYLRRVHSGLFKKIMGENKAMIYVVVLMEHAWFSGMDMLNLIKVDTK